MIGLVLKRRLCSVCKKGFQHTILTRLAENRLYEDFREAIVVASNFPVLSRLVLSRRVLVSELSGQSNILSKVEDSGMASKSELKGSKVWKERMGQVRTIGRPRR